MRKCIFVGYPDGIKGWKFYDPETQKLIVSNDVKFNELTFLGTRPLPSYTTHSESISIPVEDNPDIPHKEQSLPLEPADQPLRHNT